MEGNAGRRLVRELSREGWGRAPGGSCAGDLTGRMVADTRRVTWSARLQGSPPRPSLLSNRGARARERKPFRKIVGVPPAHESSMKQHWGSPAPHKSESPTRALARASRFQPVGGRAEPVNGCGSGWVSRWREAQEPPGMHHHPSRSESHTFHAPPPMSSR